ncbi:MAG TPA: MerR family transcriptional regulator [Fimbriimonadaceae bacterium]|nr:MerR family transcriptional regulator [Fimbriimonadaceae bacterium]
MPSVNDYRALAPFTLDEFIQAANSILRDRPSLQISARTVRYYISEGILPPPIGPNRIARYSLEHLARVVEAREGLGQGASLNEIAENMGVTRDRSSSKRSPSSGELTRIELGDRIVLEFPADRDIEMTLIDAATRILNRAKPRGGRNS